MKKVIDYVKKRLNDEATQLKRLEHDILVYETVISNGWDPSSVGNCEGCDKLVNLDHFIRDNEACTVVCIECGPKECFTCGVYHVEDGVDEWKEKQRKKRRKKRRIVLG